MRDQDISQRRACRLVGADPKMVRRERRPDRPEIPQKMKEIAGKCRRFGYRRIGVLFERKGMIMNHKKLYRLNRAEGLAVKRRRGRKRARGSRPPMPEATQPNQRWSLDFLADSFGASRKFRILAVDDDCYRENLCRAVDTSISGEHVARELDALVRIYGKPQQNAFIESFNGGLRDELLNEELFDTLDDARRKLALWRYDYNNDRPHSSLANRTPKQAQQAHEQFEGSAPAALAKTQTDDFQNQTRRLSS